MRYRRGWAKKKRVVLQFVKEVCKNAWYKRATNAFFPLVLLNATMKLNLDTLRGIG